MASYHVGGEKHRWEFFITGDPLEQATRAEHQAERGQVIVSTETWRAIGNVAAGNILQQTGDVELTSISRPIPIRSCRALNLGLEAEAGLSQYM